jgi:hypothetical protein
MSAPNPFKKPGLRAALERYRTIRHIVCGLGPDPCTKVEHACERTCVEELENEHGCQFDWHYNEPFDSAYYHRATSVGCGHAQPPPDPPGKLRVGMIVMPEVLNRNGLIAAHAIVEVLGSGGAWVR